MSHTNKKTYLALFIVFCLLFSVSLISCGSNETESNNVSKKEITEYEAISLAKSNAKAKQAIASQCGFSTLVEIRWTKAEVLDLKGRYGVKLEGLISGYKGSTPVIDQKFRATVYMTSTGTYQYTNVN